MNKDRLWMIAEDLRNIAELIDKVASGSADMETLDRVARQDLEPIVHKLKDLAYRDRAEARS